jgi:hypothetical protein
MSNEERIEEILYQAHVAGNVETFYDLVNQYQSRNQDKSKRLIDFYEMAHFRLKTNRFNSK